jgi:hypothetical protein
MKLSAGTILFVLSSLLFLVYPKTIIIPNVKPYLVILVSLIVAAAYSIWKRSNVLRDKYLFSVLAISCVASGSMLARSGLENAKDYVWFNYFVVTAALMYVVIKTYAEENGNIESVFRISVYCSFVVCGVELIEIVLGRSWDFYFTGGLTSYRSVDMGGDTAFRPGSIIGNPIPLSAFCGTISVLTFNRLLLKINKTDLVAFILNFISTLMTLSRSGVIGLAVGLVVSAWVHLPAVRKKNRWKMYFTCGSLFLVMLSVGYTYHERMDQLTERFGLVMRDENSLYRIEQWKGAMSELADDYSAVAIGMGQGAAAAYYGRGISYEARDDSGVANTFDNSIVSFAYQYGLLGVGAMILLTALLLVKTYRSQNPREYWRFGVVASLYASSLFYEIFVWFPCMYILCLCFAWPIKPVEEWPDGGGHRAGVRPGSVRLALARRER